MERRDVVRRALIAEFSTNQLSRNLFWAGVHGDDAVCAMDREQMIDAWVELVATGKGVAAVPVATASSDATAFGWERVA